MAGAFGRTPVLGRSADQGQDGTEDLARRLRSASGRQDGMPPQGQVGRQDAPDPISPRKPVLMPRMAELSSILGGGKSSFPRGSAHPAQARVADATQDGPAGSSYPSVHRPTKIILPQDGAANPAHPGSPPTSRHGVHPAHPGAHPARDPDQDGDQDSPHPAGRMNAKDSDQDGPGGKGEFIPGKPGQPRAGATHHQLLRDPGFIQKLQPVIAKWEKANPGRVLKGPAIKGMLTHIGVDISDAAAGKMASKIEAAKQKIQEQKLMQLMGAAAKKGGQ